MKPNQHLFDWQKIVSSKFASLSLPQIRGLATWSFGMVMTRSSSLSKVSVLIANANGESENTVRQRLKEWYKSGQDKGKFGHRRASLEVQDCFASLLSWIIDLLPENNRSLALAMDATNVGQDFTVLSINVLYRRCAIPVAWKVVRGKLKGSWKPHWQELYHSLRDVVPKDYLVVVSADRGLYAEWLYREIVALGWHPFLRINHQGYYRPCDSDLWQPLATVLTAKNRSWSGQITCFKNNPVESTLLAHWDEQYTDPWLVLTDLEPNQADLRWYQLRCWIECGYRDVKSDGFNWHKTRLRQSDRAEHHWLAMSVAMLWIVTLGGEQERFGSSQKINHSSDSNLITPTPILSCFVQGSLTLIAQLLNGQPLSFGRLFPIHTNRFHCFPLSNSS